MHLLTFYRTWCIINYLKQLVINIMLATAETLKKLHKKHKSLSDDLDHSLLNGGASISKEGLVKIIDNIKYLQVAIDECKKQINIEKAMELIAD